MNTYQRLVEKLDDHLAMMETIRTDPAPFNTSEWAMLIRTRDTLIRRIDHAQVNAT